MLMAGIVHYVTSGVKAEMRFGHSQIERGMTLASLHTIALYGLNYCKLTE